MFMRYLLSVRRTAYVGNPGRGRSGRDLHGTSRRPRSAAAIWRMSAPRRCAVHGAAPSGATHATDAVPIGFVSAVGVPAARSRSHAGRDASSRSRRPRILGPGPCPAGTCWL